MRRRRRMIALSLLASFLCVIVGSFVLYLVRILLITNQTNFIAYVAQQEEVQVPEPPSQSRRSLLKTTPAAAMPSAPVIVSVVSTSDVSFTVSEFESFNPLDATNLGDVAIGGDIAGSGLGSGSGKGGGDGSGKGNRMVGYNDDIQVVLALDASGSMDALFADVAQSIDKVLFALQSAKLNGKPVTVNVGVVVYGQAENGGSPFVLSPFTTDIDSLRAKIAAQPCNGGLEPCGEAVDHAVKNFPWNMRNRDDMLKAVFICGNEPFNQGNVNYKEAVSLAAERHIIVNTVHCGNVKEPPADWADAAMIGKGRAMVFMPGSHDHNKERSQMHEILAELSKITPLPTGSPVEQAELMKQVSPIPEPPSGEDSFFAWMLNYSQAVRFGYDWDAIERCRRMGIDRFTLEHIGGRGNLPLSLRSKSDAEALEFIRNAARSRSNLLEQYNKFMSNMSFSMQVIDCLKAQAKEKGILIAF